LAPLSTLLTTAFAFVLAVVTVDVDEHPDLAAQFGIRAMPTVLAFRTGDQVSGFKGALPEGQLRKFLDDIPK